MGDDTRPAWAKELGIAADTWPAIRGHLDRELSRRKEAAFTEPTDNPMRCDRCRMIFPSIEAPTVKYVISVDRIYVADIRLCDPCSESDALVVVAHAIRDRLRSSKKPENV